MRRLRSGALRHVGRIERIVPTLDDSSSPLPVYETIAAEVRFAIEDLTAREFMQVQQIGAQLSTKIRIRWRPGIEATMRLARQINPGAAEPAYEYYEIQGITRDERLTRDLVLLCVKRDSDGFRGGEVIIPFVSVTADSTTVTADSTTVTADHG